MIRILVADDQAMVRGALSALLELEADIEVVAQAGDGEQAVAAAIEHQVDVALLDIQMPVMDGLQAAARLRSLAPDCRILMVTTFARPGYQRRAFEAGAHGFVVKDAPASELADAVRRVHAGIRVVDPSLAAESLLGPANPLTAREGEILALAERGEPVALIAARIHLSVGTVRNHLSSAIGKTGAVNRIEAANIAVDKGWI